MPVDLRRRTFVVAGAALLAAPRAVASPGGESFSVGEDLMKEHGVLRRVMLTYDEIVRRLAAREAVPVDAVSAASQLVRSYIQDFHEELEERLVFPPFEKAGKLRELVATMRTQHDSGRTLIDGVLELAKGQLRHDAARKKLADRLGSFVRMYRAHAGWEDTVLFPSLEEILGSRGYRELGERFEQEEKKLGELGMDEALAQVAKVERTLGIDDLAKYTP